MQKIEMELMDFISAHLPGINEADKTELRLIFSELIANAIFHGNKSDTRKKVTLEADILPSSIVVGKICDEGDGFDYHALLHNAYACDVYKESGRGIRLVHRLADKLIFNFSGKEIIFHKRVSVDG